MTPERKLELVIALEQRLQKASNIAALGVLAVLHAWLASLLGETWPVKTALAVSVFLLSLLGLVIVRRFVRVFLEKQSATKAETNTPEFPPPSPDGEAVLHYLMRQYPAISREREIWEATKIPPAAVRVSLEDLAKRKFVSAPKYRLQLPLECSETGYNDHGMWGVEILPAGIGYVRGQTIPAKPGSWRYGHK
jgi:hypothetical protein